MVGDRECGGEEPRWLFIASLARDDCCAKRRAASVVERDVSEDGEIKSARRNAKEIVSSRIK